MSGFRGCSYVWGRYDIDYNAAALLMTGCSRHAKITTIPKPIYGIKCRQVKAFPLRRGLGRRRGGIGIAFDYTHAITDAGLLMMQECKKCRQKSNTDILIFIDSDMMMLLMR